MMSIKIGDVNVHVATHHEKKYLLNTNSGIDFRIY